MDGGHTPLKTGDKLLIRRVRSSTPSQQVLVVAKDPMGDSDLLSLRISKEEEPRVMLVRPIRDTVNEFFLKPLGMCGGVGLFKGLLLTPD